MPTIDDLRNKVTFELYHCPEFSITGVLFPGNRMHLHLDWPNKKFTPSIYKKGLTALAQIKRAALDRGIPAVYVIVTEDLVKWERMLGFSVIEQWSNRINPAKPLFLMKQECA